MSKDMLFVAKVKICISTSKGLRKGGNKILLSNGMRWPQKEPS